MKANNLRIGNWLEFEDKTMTVSSIHIDDTIRFKVPYGGSIGCFKLSAHIKPIPLTEEWLLRFGFENYETDKSRVYRLNGFMATYVFNGRFKGKRYLKYHNITFEDFGHIQHVHQLQNLYFSLTGEELEIK